MSFEKIKTRVDGVRYVTAEWFNSLRSAGVITDVKATQQGGEISTLNTAIVQQTAKINALEARLDASSTGSATNRVLYTGTPLTTSGRFYSITVSEAIYGAASVMNDNDVISFRMNSTLYTGGQTRFRYFVWELRELSHVVGNDTKRRDTTLCASGSRMNNSSLGSAATGTVYFQCRTATTINMAISTTQMGGLMSITLIPIG